MQDPVILVADGHSYEESAIREWFGNGNSISPASGQSVQKKDFKRNWALKKVIDDFRVKRYHNVDMSKERKKQLGEEMGLGRRLVADTIDSPAEPTAPSEPHYTIYITIICSCLAVLGLLIYLLFRQWRPKEEPIQLTQIRVV